MLIIIDGPEKVGKSTLIRRLAEKCRPLHAVVVASRYPSDFDASIFRDAVRLGARSDTVVVMDRAWPSDVVYSALVRHSDAAVPDVWYEWTLGLAAMTLGVRLVLAPPTRLAPLDLVDHVVDYDVERAAFVQYAKRWAWDVVDDPVAVDAGDVLERCVSTYRSGPVAPAYAGSRHPTLVWVGEARNELSTEPLAWAPLSTRFWLQELTKQLPEVTAAWPHVATTNAADLPNVAHLLQRHGTSVVAYGVEACHALHKAKIMHEPRVHPAAAYRWGRYRRTQ